MNSQGLFNITDSTYDDSYDFTNIECNRGTVASERVLNNVVQELHGGTITESQGSIGQKGMEFDPTITISKTQETVHGFELDKQIRLLYPINDTVPCCKSF